ncbi:MAG: hypothetical protein ACLS6O_00190 [Bifidobacterium sp.]
MSTGQMAVVPLFVPATSRPSSFAHPPVMAKDSVARVMSPAIVFRWALCRQDRDRPPISPAVLAVPAVHIVSPDEAHGHGRRVGSLVPLMVLEDRGAFVDCSCWFIVVSFQRPLRVRS